MGGNATEQDKYNISLDYSMTDINYLLNPRTPKQP